MKKLYNRPLTLSLRLSSDQMLLAASTPTPGPTTIPGVSANSLPGHTPGNVVNMSGAGENNSLTGGSVNDAW